MNKVGGGMCPANCFSSAFVNLSVDFLPEFD
jgi:hypothetical protein